jgi:hypothetical protein
MNCLIVTKYRVKQLLVILLGVLLLGQQIAPLSAVTFEPAPCCMKATMSDCAAACGSCDCCVSHPSQNSKPAPAVPTQSRIQNQILLLAPTTVAWTLPENKAPSFTSTEQLPLTDAIAPLYAKNCTRLL